MFGKKFGEIPRGLPLLVCMHCCTVFVALKNSAIIFFSAKRDTEPRPIRGFLRDPDFRRGRDPLTGREGYSTIYEARKKVNTLVSRLLIVRICETSSDWSISDPLQAG